MTRQSGRQERRSEFPAKSNRIVVPIFLAGLGLLAVGIVAIRARMAVQGQGVIEAREYARAYAARTGCVSEILVDEGDTVAEGQLIVLLEPPAAERTIIAETEAEIGILRLQRALLELEAREQVIALLSPDISSAPERMEALKEMAELEERIEDALESLNGVIISSTDFNRQQIQTLRAKSQVFSEAAKTALASSDWPQIVKEKFQTEIALVDARIANLERNLTRLRDEMRVSSPVSGRIGSLSVSFRGEPVTEGQLIAEIVGDQSRWQARVWLPQRNIDLIHPGLEARMASHVFNSRLEGYIHGVVDSVSPLPERRDSSTPSEPEYEAIIEILETPFPLEYGSTVDVEVFIGGGTLLEIILGRPSDLRLGGQSGR